MGGGEREITYRVPWKIVLAHTFETGDFAAYMFLILMLITPFLWPLLPSSFRPVVEDLAVILFLLILAFVLLGRLLPHSLENWILENVKCPECGGKIKSCTPNLPNYFRDDHYLPDRDTAGYYTVQCSNCDKKFAFTFRGFSPDLSFAFEANEGVAKEINDRVDREVKKALIFILIVAILFIVILLILLAMGVVTI